MPATTSKTTPKAAGGATKAAPTATSTAAETKRTTRVVEAAADQAERTLRALATDGAYVTVGIADNAVALLRGFPARVNELRVELPKTVEGRARSLLEETPKELQARLETVRTSAEKELDEYAARGRTVVEQLASAAATKRAVEQARTALTSVKAASANVRRAAGRSADAVEEGAEQVGA